jgi:hypothetical protein
MPGKGWERCGRVRLIGNREFHLVGIKNENFPWFENVRSSNSFECSLVVMNPGDGLRRRPRGSSLAQC